MNNNTTSLPRPTLKNRIKEFEKSQNKSKSVSRRNRRKQVNKNNPYLLARVQVLNELPVWRRNEVMRMEENNDIDNHHYAQFIKMIAERGDILSNQ